MSSRSNGNSGNSANSANTPVTPVPTIPIITAVTAVTALKKVACPVCATPRAADLALCPDCGDGDAAATPEQRQRVVDGLHAWLRQAAPLLAGMDAADPLHPAALARYRRREHLARMLDLERELLETEAAGDAAAFPGLLRAYERLARQGGEAGYMEVTAA